MDYGFDASGNFTAAEHDSCYYKLTVESDRAVLSTKDNNFASMYSFGSLVRPVLQSDFNWENLLSVLPTQESPEKEELIKKLLPQKTAVNYYLEDELGAQPLSQAEYLQLVEVYARLFPAFGLLSDSSLFISDDFYGFEPSWLHQGFHNAPDFKTLTREAFGSHRKDLLKAVRSSSGSTISLLSHFRDCLEQEQLIEILASDLPASLGGWSILGVNYENALEDLSHFEQLPKVLRFRLVKSLFEGIVDGTGDGFTFLAIVRDTLTMLSFIDTQKYRYFRSDKNWFQVHTRAVTLSADNANEHFVETIELPHAVEVLEGFELPPIKLDQKTSELARVHHAEAAGAETSSQLKLLRKPLDYILAGSTDGLHNCMGSAGYYTKAKKGDSYCAVAVTPSGKLVAGVELTYEDSIWRVLQLNGYDNAPIANREELKSSILLKLNGEHEAARYLEEPENPPGALPVLEDEEPAQPLDPLPLDRMMAIVANQLREAGIEDPLNNGRPLADYAQVIAVHEDEEVVAQDNDLDREQELEGPLVLDFPYPLG